MKKILFISSWYPTSLNPNFGVFVKEHAKAINSTGNEIIVLAIVVHRTNDFYKKSITDNYDENGIRTIEIEIYSKYRDTIYHFIPLQYRIVLSTYKRLIEKEFVPDVIHSNVIFPAGIIGDKLSKRLKKPHFITEHWSRINGFVKKPILGKWGIKALQNATKVFPVSKFLKTKIVEAVPSLDTKKIVVIGNVVDSEIFNFSADRNNNSTLRFCAIATWNTKRIPDKLPDLFIEALSEWQKRTNQKAELVIIGGGNRLEELEQHCKLKNICATFTGYLPKEKIASILKQSNFLLHASTIETFGVVVAEALLCGTPVICSDVGALPELIQDGFGVLCNNTVYDWTEAIEKGTKIAFDNQKIASSTIEKYSLREIGKTIVNNYETDSHL
jgi:glycosyltransferase involved in cell wall biosynthesis